MSGARDEAREGDVGVSASQTLPPTSVCLRGGGPFSLEVGVEHASVCARERARACVLRKGPSVPARATRAGARVGERRWAGCGPRGGPGWALWRRARGGLDQRGLVASGRPALAGASSGVIFASAHSPQLSFSPLPPGPASPALPGEENSWICSALPGRSAAVSDSAWAGRVHSGGLRGKRAVTAWVTLVAEAGI